MNDYVSVKLTFFSFTCNLANKKPVYGFRYLPIQKVSCTFRSLSIQMHFEIRNLRLINQISLKMYSKPQLMNIDLSLIGFIIKPIDSLLMQMLSELIATQPCLSSAESNEFDHPLSIIDANASLLLAIELRFVYPLKNLHIHSFDTRDARH